MGFPNRNLNQTAVYWGSPTNDGYGGFTWATPVEISCRWVDSTRVISDNRGREMVSRAEVQVGQDVDEQGMLYLGSLSDLSEDQKSDPTLVNNAYQIMRLDKVPTMNGLAYFRMAYLGEGRIR